MDWIVSTEKTEESGRLVSERTTYDPLLTGGYGSETGQSILRKYPKQPTGEPEFDAESEETFMGNLRSGRTAGG